MSGTRTSQSWQTRVIGTILLDLFFLLGPACRAPLPDPPPPPRSISTAQGDSDSDTAEDTGTATHEPPLVVWAVRHAEKDSGDDPSLTEEGAERALALSEVLVDTPLVAVFATDLKRSQETCQPTADDHELPVVIDIDPEEDLAEWVLGEHMGQQVLHCGHSYTIPDFLDALGVVDEEYLSGYGQIWIVTITPRGKVSVEMGFFGEE
jgi:hypothetical protein